MTTNQLLSLSYFPSSYSKENLLPQSQSAEQLSAWLASNHEEYNLNAWCFYGRLGELKKGGELNQDCKSFFIMQQYYQDPSQDVSKAALGEKSSMSVMGYSSQDIINDSSLEGPLLSGAVAENSNSFNLNVQQNPWAATSHTALTIDDFEITSFISISLTSGKMGQKGATYQLTVNAICITEKKFSLVPVTITIEVKDVFGTINQGYSSAGFAPSTISQEIIKEINNDYDGSIKKYLENTPSALTSNISGTYSYSLPMLDVISYKAEMYYQSLTEESLIGENFVIEGTGGNIWVDMMVGTNKAPKGVKSADWLFYALPIFGNDDLPNCAITTTQMTINNDSNDVFSWANLVTDHKDVKKYPNGSLPPISAKLDSIKYSVKKTWTSPVSNNKYPVEVDITMEFDDPTYKKATLTCTSLWHEQEIVKNISNPEKSSVYEGLVKVSGHIEKRKKKKLISVDSIGWCEVSPQGKND